MDRICLKIVGESGAGLLSTGKIITRALRDLGYYVVADREYPSLIKGGHSCFIVNACKEPVFGLAKETEIMLAIDKQSLVAYFDELKDGGILVHGYERPRGLKDLMEEAEGKGIKVVHLMAREIAEEMGGNYLMSNVVLAGMLWKVLGLPYEVIHQQVEKQFADKPALLEIDLKCVRAGYNRVEVVKQLDYPKIDNARMLIDGNQALALGAVHCGVRIYVAYPMSPASTILTQMSEWMGKTGVLVKQGEDEITVAQMALGAMYMGARALAATSGGGYDLMTETVSLAGISETPLVLVVAQRPGPGTGLPTWTMQGDLNLAIYSSHGEFSRLVVAVSDPEDCFELIQHAFNYAEVYQIPVIVLTEKVIAESIMSVEPFAQKTIPVERGLVEGEELKNLENSDRYRITESGLSKRWLPGSSEKFYFANGDEHWEDGSVNEDTPKSAIMYEKRMKKLKLIKENLPEPEIFGENDSDISFIGWGSSKNVMRDVIRQAAKEGIKVNYLHYSYVYPLKETAAVSFFENNKKVCLIEGNYLGQFGNLVEAESGKKFHARLLKFDGRPFYLEEVLDFIKKQI